MASCVLVTGVWEGGGNVFVLNTFLSGKHIIDGGMLSIVLLPGVRWGL